jgi:predicted nucleotidyltransferase
MNEKIEILDRCKQILSAHYGSALEGVLIYGSVARGEAETGSDIDLLILLNEPFDYFQELWQIVNLLYPVQLYRNAKREGVLV